MKTTLTILAVLAAGLMAAGCGGKGGKHGPTADKSLRLRRVVLTDDNLGQSTPAFTMLAPADWKVSFSLVYRMDRPAAPADIGIVARSPDGQEEFKMAPQVMATWSPALAQMWNQPQYLGNDLMQCPAEAADFFRQLVLPRLHPGLRPEEATIVDTRTYPEIARQMEAAAAGQFPGRCSVQVAHVCVEYKDPQTGQTMQEDIGGTLFVGTTTNMGFNGQQDTSTVWVTDRVFSCRAPKGTLGRHADLYACMAGSVRPDEQWMAGYQRAMARLMQSVSDTSASIAQRSRIIAQNGADTARIIRDTYQNRQETLGRTNRQWDQYIRGTAAYQTPHEDHPVELPAGYDHVWTSGKGEYFLSNNPSDDPGRGSNLAWEKIRQVR